MNAAATPSPLKWNRIGMLLHWLIALLIVGLATVGLLMTDMANSPTKISVYALHKSTGITVLALVALRLLWRLGHRAPAAVVGTPRWQRIVAFATHAALYALMFLMPLSGWLFNSAANFPLQWFGLVRLPALSGPDRALKSWALDVHVYGFYVLAALVSLHIAASIWHHWHDRDATLVRMLPDGWLHDPSIPNDAPGETTP
jgi:cytochrome b561